MKVMKVNLHVNKILKQIPSTDGEQQIKQQIKETLLRQMRHPFVVGQVKVSP